jgi:hypothetical protein
MAFTVAHGILGIEGIHRIADLVDLGDNESPLPRIEIDRITGLHSLPEADDNRENRYGQGGELVYRSLARGRTITYEGRILAADLYALRALTRNFRHAASSGRLGELAVVVRPHAAIGGVSHTYRARTLALEIDDEQLVGYEAMPTPYQRGFIFTLRQSDPRYYLVGTVSGGGGSGAVVTLNNTGNAPAVPNFTINGPISNGTVDFNRLGNTVPRLLRYSGVTLANGQIAVLNFLERTFTRSDGESLEHLRVFDDSNWWDAGSAGLNAGVTQVSVSGGNAWTVSFAPASW